MARVSSQATIIIHGVTPGGLPPDAPLAQITREVHTLAHYNLTRAPGATTTNHNGVPGISGPLVMRKQLEAVVAGDASGVLSALVYSVLRQTGTAVCIDRGGKGKTPTWFVSNSFPSDDELDLAVRRVMRQEPDYKETYTERRLTPKEAGEDRPAAPVVVKKTAPSAPTPDTGLTSNELKELILATVQESDIPLTAVEILETLGLPSQDLGRVSSITRTLMKAGKLFTRIETNDEMHLRAGKKPSKLYSAVSPVPARDKALSTTRTKLVYDAMPETIERVHAALTDTPQRVTQIAKRAGLSDAAVRRVLRNHPRPGVSHTGPSYAREYFLRPRPLTGVVQPPSTEAEQQLSQIRQLLGAETDVAALREENERLTAENQALKDELESLKTQIRGLLG